VRCKISRVDEMLAVAHASEISSTYIR